MISKDDSERYATAFYRGKDIQKDMGLLSVTFASRYYIKNYQRNKKEDRKQIKNKKLPLNKITIKHNQIRTFHFQNRIHQKLRIVVYCAFVPTTKVYIYL